jgi:hypothetical protein
MPNYRAYVMGSGDTIRTVTNFESPDDATAIVAARLLSTDEHVELWRRTQRIVRLTPSDL